MGPTAHDRLSRKHLVARLCEALFMDLHCTLNRQLHRHSKFADTFLKAIGRFDMSSIIDLPSAILWAPAEVLHEVIDKEILKFDTERARVRAIEDELYGAMGLEMVSDEDSDDDEDYIGGVEDDSDNGDGGAGEFDDGGYGYAEEDDDDEEEEEEEEEDDDVEEEDDEED
eukprot:Opistho-2@51784